VIAQAVPLFQQQHVAGVDLLERDLLLPDRGIGFARHERELVLEQLAHVQVAGVEGQRDQRDVEASRAQPLEQARGEVLAQVELQVSVRLAGAGQAADDRAEATAVNEPDLAQVQDDGAAVAQQPGNVRAQQFVFVAGNNPPVASYDGDASNLPSIQRQAQWASDAAGIKPAKSPHYIHENATRGTKTGRGARSRKSYKSS